MSEYKLYCIGDDGHIQKRHDYMAADDLAALDRARELCHEYEIEIWQGSRCITRVAKDGTASAIQAQARGAPGYGSLAREGAADART